MSGNKTDAGEGTASVTLLRVVLAALKQTGSALADSLTVVQGSIASVCILIGKSIIRTRSFIHPGGHCTYVSKDATVRPIGEETLALVACHASRAFVGSHGHTKPESEVDEVHLNRDAVICCGGGLCGLCMVDCIQKPVTMRYPKAVFIPTVSTLLTAV